MAGTFDKLVVNAYHGRSASDLAGAPVDAIAGVSASDAEKLRDAFRIETVEELASSPLVRAAQAIAEAAAGLKHDRGPDPEWSAFFETAPLAVYQAHPSNFRLAFGPVWYRGRLDGTARVLVVGQDPAANELVGQRVFVGASGQRIQGFLRKLGIRRDYVMINTFLYPVFGQFSSLEALSHDAQIMKFRNDLLDRVAKDNPLEAVIGVGRAGKDAVERWQGLGNLKFEAITHPSAHDNAALLADWNQGLTVLRPVVDTELGVAPDTTTYGTDWTDADHVPIPRRDLPFGVPEWHGVGSHARRGRKADGSTDHKLINWTAP